MTRRLSLPTTCRAATLMLAFSLAACSASQLDSVLPSTGASMRVDVEVYKGPLALDPEVQWGEFVGTLKEAGDSIDLARDFFLETVCIRLNFVCREIDEDLVQAKDSLARLRVAVFAFDRAFYGSTSRVQAATPARVFQSRKGAMGLARISESPAPVANDILIDINSSFRQICEAEAVFGRLDSNKKSVQPSRPDQTTQEKKAEEVKKIDRQIQVSPPSPAKNVTEFENSYLIDRYQECLRRLKAKAAAARKPNDGSDEMRHSKPSVELSTIAKLGEALRNYTLTVEDDLIKDAIQDLGYPPLPLPGATRPLTSDEVAAARRALYAIFSTASAVARQFRIKASVWSHSHVGYPSLLYDDRKSIVTLATLLSTYADRIGLRADTLIKQVKGDDRREQPLSVALRETDPPTALQQYVWDAPGSIRLQDFSTDTIRDRVRGMERLYAGENWANINTVHASGQGTVRMALIKDDIGNWNLKSFDQDPSELLNAYKNVGLAALKVATDFAKTAVTGGAGAAALGVLQTANQIATGSAPGGSPTVGTADIASLRGDLVKSLEAIRDKAVDDAKKLDTRIKDLTADQKAKKAAAESTEGDYKTSVKARGIVEDETKKEQAAVAAIAIYKPIVEENERLANDTSLTEAQRNDRKTFAAENKTRLAAEESKRDASRALINSNKDDSDKLEARTKAKDEGAAALKKVDDDLKKAQAERDGGLAAAALASAQQAIKDHEAVINALDTALSRKSSGGSGAAALGGANIPTRPSNPAGTPVPPN